MRAHLPDGLEPIDQGTGAIMLWECPSGATLGNGLSSLNYGIEVKGFDAPDGTPAMYFVEASFPEEVLPVIRESHCGSAVVGSAEVVIEPSRCRGIGVVERHHALSVSMSLTGEVQAAAGSLLHLCRNASGQMIRFSVPWRARTTLAKVEELQIGEGATGPLKDLAPGSIVLAYLMDEMDFTWDVPEVSSTHRDPVAELRRLSLTPAEARIALRVGEGRSPRETADSLGISENTVRSALKQIFSKLGVNRQAELVRLVSGISR